MEPHRNGTLPCPQGWGVEEELAPQLTANGLQLVRLATPTTDAARLPTVVGGAAGFVYYVAVAGVTGTKSASIG